MRLDWQRLSGVGLVLAFASCSAPDRQFDTLDAGGASGAGAVGTTAAGGAISGGSGGSGPRVVCYEGEHDCAGLRLLVCNEDGSGFSLKETCTNTSPCNADAKACTDLACLPDQKRCDGDNLEECNADSSGWDALQTCDTDLCDPVDLECDVCNPNAKRCGDKARESCDDEGQAWVESACPQGKPVCVGDGDCVECDKASDCKPPTDCFTNATCRDNKCEFTQRPKFCSCSNGKLCDSSGQCTLGSAGAPPSGC